nr:E3 ubiquitin-protein ligase MBR2-like [Tanacetum cinerariifolium]
FDRFLEDYMKADLLEKTRGFEYLSLCGDAITYVLENSLKSSDACRINNNFGDQTRQHCNKTSLLCAARFLSVSYAEEKLNLQILDTTSRVFSSLVCVVESFHFEVGFIGGGERRKWWLGGGGCGASGSHGYGSKHSAKDYMLFDPFMNGVADLHERHRDMRLDVDNMSYEEFLALEERIRDVKTGLPDDVTLKLVKQRKHMLFMGSSWWTVSIRLSIMSKTWMVNVGIEKKMPIEFRRK